VKLPHRRLLPVCVYLLSLAVLTNQQILARPVEAAGAGPLIGLRPSNAHGKTIPGPGYFVLHGVPGQYIRLYAHLFNHGQRAGTVSLTPVDARHDIYGNISYNLPNARRKEVGSWIRLFSGTVYLRKHESFTVPFIVHIPKTCRPGKYIGALTAFVPLKRRAARGRAQVLVQVRMADAIVVTVRPPKRQVGR
jgi:hypothetical protein